MQGAFTTVRLTVARAVGEFAVVITMVAIAAAVKGASLFTVHLRSGHPLDEVFFALSWLLLPSMILTFTAAFALGDFNQITIATCADVVTGYVLQALFLGEHVGTLTYVGAILVITGVVSVPIYNYYTSK